jgi:prepilin-type N-terminal cleavage/methylation domain-containing protein
MESSQSASHKRRAGFSLIEVVVVLGIIGALAAAATPSIQEMIVKRRVQGAARDLANMFQIARSQAIRTGNFQIVFFGPPGTTDPAGTALTDTIGTSVPLLLLDDGSPSTANCHIDGGEDRETMPAQPLIGWGVSEATVKVPTDTGGAAFVPPQTSGTTVADPSNTPTNWVLFRPDGIPVGFDPTPTTCGTIGDTGTGGAGLYITSGGRDYAVTLAPLGSVRVHAWNGSGWTQ